MRQVVADARLAWRLFLHGDRQGRIATVLACVGVAVAVAAALFVIAVPRALDAADVRNVARTPIGQPGEHGMRITSSTELLDGAAWTRVYVAQPSPDSALPPGVPRWPAPGTTLVSPQLRSVLAGRDDASQLVADQSPDLIGDAGLLSPDELISYEVYSGRGGSDVVVTGFGDPGARGAILSPALLLQLVALVGLPVLLFLLVVMRLSLRSRQRRSAALHLIGIGARRAARLFALEMALVAAVGSATGALAYVVALPWVADSGVFGFRWFAADTTVSWWLALVVVALFTGITARLALVVMTSSVDDTWVEAPPRRRRGALGAALFLPALTVAAALVALAAGITGAPRQLSEGVYMPTVLGCIVAGVVGLLLLLPTLVRAACGWVARRATSPTTRLGARLAGAHAPALTPLAAGLAAVVLLAGAGEAVLRGMYLDGVGDLSRVTTDVSMDDLGPTARAQLLAIDAPAQSVTITGLDPLPADPQTPDAKVYPLVTVATCPHIEALLADLPGAANCSGRPQRLGWDGDPSLRPAGTPVRVRLSDGSTRTIATPAERYDIPAGGILLPPAAAPWLATVTQARVTFQTSALDGSYDALMARIHERVPGARPMTVYKDPEALTRHLRLTAIMRTGITVAAVLTALALALTLLDLRWRTRTGRAAQQAIGISRRALRRCAAVQVGLPIAVTLAAAAPFTLAIGWLYTGYWGPAQLFAENVTRGVALTGVLALVTTGVGAVLLSWGPFELRDLSED